ncbi:MAG TPA: hypothetical protein VFM30_02390, partial [Steroidobacteraceae bacterium]|nr:hypothetical protein [Steroidobacteraceae bacterium]
MTNLETNKPRSKRPLVLGAIAIVAVAILAGGLYLAPRFERQAPVITLTPDGDMVGRAPIEIDITDPGAGLRSVTATLSAGGADHVLATESFSTPARTKKIGVAVASLKGVKEGPAVLKVTARDRSMW